MKNNEVDPGIWLPKRVRRRWPATMFAARRMLKVKGRIRELTNSIKTIKGIKAKGVPSGTKWANIWEEVFLQAVSICPNHKGRAKLTVNTGCLEDVKMKGNNPRKLFNAIVRNKEKGITSEPTGEEGITARNSS